MNLKNGVPGVDFYYETYYFKLSGYACLSRAIKDHELENAEIVSTHQEMDGEGSYAYRIIFKIPIEKFEKKEIKFPDASDIVESISQFDNLHTFDLNSYNEGISFANKWINENN